MKTTKTATAPRTARIATAPKAEHQEPLHADTNKGSFDEIYKRFQDAQSALLGFFDAPSWKRSLAAFVAGLAVTLVGGFMLASIVEWLLVGAIMAGTAPFIAIVVALITTIIGSVWIARKSARVFGAVLTGEADERAVAAYDATKNFFRRINPFGKAEVSPAK